MLQLSRTSLALCLFASYHLLETHLSSASEATESEIFQKLSDLDDLVMVRGTLATITVVSKLNCAQECAGVAECVAFTFIPAGQDGSPRQCWIYDQPADTENVEVSLKARSYSKYQEEEEENESTPGECDAGFTYLCGSCLTATSTLMYQPAAQTYCQGQSQSQLVMAQTQDDLDCIVQAFVTLSGLALQDIGLYKYLWLGAQYQAASLQHVWFDDTALPSGIPLWRSGEPQTQACVGADLHQEALVDLGCSHDMYAMCQKQP